MLGIDAKTIRKHMYTEFKRGKAKMIAVVANKLYEGAVKKDCARRQEFILKTQGAPYWNETQHIITQDGGKFISDKPMTDEEFEAQYDTSESDSVEATAETENID